MYILLNKSKHRCYSIEIRGCVLHILFFLLGFNGKGSFGSPFLIIIDMASKFYSSYGDVETDKPWRSPNMLRLSDWYKQFILQTELHYYDIWLVGSYAERLFGVYDKNTMDVDIVLTGEIRDCQKLKNILNTSVWLGWENHLMIDIVWSSDVLYSQRVPFKPFSLIRPGKTFIRKMGNHDFQKNFQGDEEYTWDCGLIQYVHYEPNSIYYKMQERLNTGQYVGVVQNLRNIFE